MKSAVFCYILTKKYLKNIISINFEINIAAQNEDEGRAIHLKFTKTIDKIPHRGI